MSTTQTMPSYRKDPSAVLDYVFDWTAWLAASETITASTVAVSPAGLAIDSQPRSGAKVTAWLSGGTLRATYLVTCHITTNQGRQDDRSIRVTVGDR